LQTFWKQIVFYVKGKFLWGQIFGHFKFLPLENEPMGANRQAQELKFCVFLGFLSSFSIFNGLKIFQQHFLCKSFIII